MPLHYKHIFSLFYNVFKQLNYKLTTYKLTYKPQLSGAAAIKISLTNTL